MLKIASLFHCHPISLELMNIIIDNIVTLSWSDVIVNECFFQLNEYVSGLTEVQGKVQGNSVICESYVLFSEEASNKFGMARNMSNLVHSS